MGGIEEKVLIDTGASASFVASDWCKQHSAKLQNDEQGYKIRLPMGEVHLANDCTELTLELGNCVLKHNFVVAPVK